ncbi:MAG: NAD(P)-dependent oxidoreductase [Deltaproteobacteria bacterium]|nr:NAD(P)-dependent oxidoreductase [Deltaproteobacteria bacterium]
MPLKNKTIFLAGATGLAGSSIIEHVMADYPDVFIRGAYRTTVPFLRHERISYVQADLTKRDECRHAVRGCDLAIMAAASTGGAGAAAAEPHRQVTDNLVMDALMLEAMYFEGIKRIVYLSSATVYQEFEGYIKEDDLDWNQEPHQSYIGIGWAKRSAEKLCRFWHEKYGMEIIIVRCANIYGHYARFDPAGSNFIPAIIRKAVDNIEPFEVWGSPDVARDVIYAGDLAAAVLLLLGHSEIKYDIFNLGFGKTVTVGEVVDLALKHVGHDPAKIIYSENRPKTIRFRALDCQKIKKVLKWGPVFSIDEGIKRTTMWWVENKGEWTK